MVTKRITIPIFYGTLHIVMTEDAQEDREAINRKYKNNLTKEDINILGFAEQRGNHTLIFINLGKLKKNHKEGIEYESEVVATIVHEAVHACNTIFINKGVKLDLRNDETQAYLTDWITKQVYKVYYKIRTS